MNTQRLVDNFLRYVQIDSESFNELEMAKAVAAELSEIGFEVYMDDCGKDFGSNAGNIYATLKGDESKETLLFSAHMDTVKPGNGVKPIITDGVIHTDGTTVLGGDDKSGIAAIIEAVRTMKEQGLNHPTIEVVLTVCEEVGLLGSRYLDYSRITAKKAVVLDSSGDAGTILNGAPGQIKVDGCFVGKAAHAGIAPETGVSAIQVAAEAASNMKLPRIAAETTANTRTFCAEYATNIVPERVRFLAEARSRNDEKLAAQKAHMVKCIEDACAKYGGKWEGEVRDSYYAYHVEADDEWMAQVVKACEAIGLKADIKPSGGGSDANNMNRNGIKALVLGTGMAKVHSVNEEITIKNLEDTARLCLQLTQM